MMGKLSFLATILLLMGLSSAIPDRFDGFNVYSLNIENDVQHSALDGLWKVLSRPVNYWKGLNRVNSIADIMVAPEDQEKFEAILVEGHFKWLLKVKNVQQLIDGEQPKVVKPRVAGEMDWISYHPLDEIYAWMDQLLVQYPDVLTDLRIGFSVEGRPLRGLKLSKKAGNSAILIEANTHAREWITAATATHFLNELLTSTDPNLVFMTNAYDWIIFPVHNPDGYAYSFEKNRMWRKNRAKNGLICYGVDPNRNWGFEWATNVEGSSDNVCQETYTGPRAFSEPEVRDFADFIAANEGYIKIFLSFHSYSQLLLYPFSYTSTPSEHATMLHEICEITAEAIKSVHGTEYVSQPSHGLYPHHGTSVDWTYGHAGITLSVTFEFRDTGDFGFILPADQIIPNAEEVQAGVIALVLEAAQRNLIVPNTE